MWHSKTDIECDCSYLDRMADDPDMPIKYDARLNEFQFVYHIGLIEGQLLIRHCPFCGGKAPPSKRSSMFAIISSSETARLVSLTKSLKTVGDVLLALGEPDEDHESGLVVTRPEKDGNPPESQSFRTLVYKAVSETADIHVTVYPQDKVTFRFQSKYI